MKERYEEWIKLNSSKVANQSANGTKTIPVKSHSKQTVNLTERSLTQTTILVVDKTDKTPPLA